MKADTLNPIIKLHWAPSCVIYSDEWRPYSSLKKLGYIHKRIKHSISIFVAGTVHTNAIESYWSYCKSRLSKFHGMNKNNFHQRTKECEYRFNHRKEVFIKVWLNFHQIIFCFLSELCYTKYRRNWQIVKPQKWYNLLKDSFKYSSCNRYSSILFYMLVICWETHKGRVFIG